MVFPPPCPANTALLMKYRYPSQDQVVAWAALFCFAIAVIADGMIGLGLSRKWQYAYNAFFFIVILPVLLHVALPKERNDKK